MQHNISARIVKRSIVVNAEMSRIIVSSDVTSTRPYRYSVDDMQFQNLQIFT